MRTKDPAEMTNNCMAKKVAAPAKVLPILRKSKIFRRLEVGRKLSENQSTSRRAFSNLYSAFKMRVAGIVRHGYSLHPLCLGASALLKTLKIEHHFCARSLIAFMIGLQLAFSRSNARMITFAELFCYKNRREPPFGQ